MRRHALGGNRFEGKKQQEKGQGPRTSKTAPEPPEGPPGSLWPLHPVPVGGATDNGQKCGEQERP